MEPYTVLTLESRNLHKIYPIVFSTVRMKGNQGEGNLLRRVTKILQLIWLDVGCRVFVPAY